MKTEIYRCDECGVEKKESNHWFRVGGVPNPAGSRSLPAATTERIALIITNWQLSPEVFTEARSLALTELHICGQNCMQKVLDRWMTEGTKVLDRWMTKGEL